MKWYQSNDPCVKCALRLCKTQCDEYNNSAMIIFGHCSHKFARFDSYSIETGDTYEPCNTKAEATARVKELKAQGVKPILNGIKYGICYKMN